MGQDTLSASVAGIQIIRESLKRKKKTQTELALDVLCSRETISSLLRGNNIQEDTFKAVCKELHLNWQDVVDESHLNNLDTDKIESLVTKLRNQVQPDIENRCGTMRIFDMTHPIGLGEIYTQVNILEKVPGKRRKKIAELLENLNKNEPLDRDEFGKVREEKIEGKEAVNKYKKLLVLGKPGAGKTTFLKYLAMESIKNQFQGDLVPFFITLKDFAESQDNPSLFCYLAKYIEGASHFCSK